MGLPGAAATALPSVFVDYAHTPDALENVLKTLRALTVGRLICLVGCGGDRDRGKRALMGTIAGQYADVVVVTSDNPRTENPETIITSIVEGVAASGKKPGTASELWDGTAGQAGYLIQSDRRLAIQTGCGLAQPGDTVLIAGKGHETYQVFADHTIDFDDVQVAEAALKELVPGA